MAVAARVVQAPSPCRVPQVRLARSAADIRASLRLRHHVFVDEMGADIACGDAIETDALDRHCQHLLVIDPVDGELLASTRLLDSETAHRIGGFYSESEFDLTAIRKQPGRILEIGRTCVAPQARQGAVIACLWSGIGALVRNGRYQQLIGCASIDARDGSARAHSLYAQLTQTQLSPIDCRVTPKRRLPPADAEKDAQTPVFSRPPLLKAYLRLGATVGGAPCWDPEFRVADLFMHLQVANLCPRYARHFLHRSRPAAHRPPVTVR